MWTIVLLNEQCPFVGTKKKTGTAYYPCSHDVNGYGVCAELYCPIEEKSMNESRSAEPKENMLTQPSGCFKCGKLHEAKCE